MDKCSEIARMAARDNLDRVNVESIQVNPKRSFYVLFGKRLVDILISFPCFILTMPINVLLGIITFYDVGSPIFFKQARLGKDGKHFYLIKFRNMTNRTDENGDLLPASERITRFGYFVRKYSLDELLNFWFVLKGDMSLIGPRPLPVEFGERYSKRHKMRTAIKPGLECPTIGNDNHARLYQEQFENDIWYVENVSFLVDCKMVYELIRMVFNKKERGDHARAGGGYLVGYDEKGNAFSMRNIPLKYEDEYRTLFDLDKKEKSEK